MSVHIGTGTKREKYTPINKIRVKGLYAPKNFYKAIMVIVSKL